MRKLYVVAVWHGRNKNTRRASNAWKNKSILKPFLWYLESIFYKNYTLGRYNTSWTTVAVTLQLQASPRLLSVMQFRKSLKCISAL